MKKKRQCWMNREPGGGTKKKNGGRKRARDRGTRLDARRANETSALFQHNIQELI